MHMTIKFSKMYVHNVKFLDRVEIESENCIFTEIISLNLKFPFFSEKKPFHVTSLKFHIANLAS